jgi:hypothetical protein
MRNAFGYVKHNVCYLERFCGDEAGSGGPAGFLPRRFKTVIACNGQVFGGLL